MASINKRGNKWQVRICRKNSPTICKTFTLLKDAQTWAKTVELRLERGEALGRDTVQLSVLLERYRATIATSKKGFKQEEPRLRAWLTHPYSQREAASLKPEDIASYRDQRLAEGKSTSTVRIELSLLSSVYKYAKHEWGFSTLSNPVTEIRRPSPSKGRDRRLEAGELEALLKATEGSFMSIVILLAIETAMRAGELAVLRWENVNLERRIAVLPDTKNGDKRVVPLSTKAIEILRSLDRTSPTVFQIQDSYVISDAFRRVTRKAGIKGLRFHDIRHEAVSRLFEKRLNLMEVASISGHRSLQMLQRYTHLRAEELALRLG
ncbi:MAG: tyrosine-type recombinase/integrase [Burkholderiales bacterium]|nr:tyrosine-type recombinase/integrase [Burkholderiales bacterium]